MGTMRGPRAAPFLMAGCVPRADAAVSEATDMHAVADGCVLMFLNALGDGWMWGNVLDGCGGIAFVDLGGRVASLLSAPAPRTFKMVEFVSSTFSPLFGITLVPDNTMEVTRCELRGFSAAGRAVTLVSVTRPTHLSPARPDPP